MIKTFIFKIKNRVWFVPSYYSFIAFLLAIGATILDTQYTYLLQNSSLTFFLTRVELAKTILSTLASSLLTMTTITFSTIMVVLTTYSSQFSPRTLEDFITDKKTLRVLGIFMGGFIYSIFTLFFIKDTDSTIYVFSATLGVLIAIICLGFFVYFIHHVSTSIQVNRLIDRLTSDILNLVEKIEAKNNSNVKIQNELVNSSDEVNDDERTLIFSKKIGYIQRIDDLALLRLAENKDIIIRVEKMIGDYVTTNANIVSVWNNNKSIEDTEVFLRHITIGSERNMLQDMEFGLKKIVEVALKALSPGINDPNTAVKCINQLGMILTRIGTANIENTYYYDNEGSLRLIFEDKSYDELLYKTFYQLRHYSNQDVSVMGAMLDALIVIAEENAMPLKEKVWDFSHYIVNGFNKKALESLDRDYINKKIKRLAYLTRNLENVKYFE
ncbi:DUF2254 domain-containing protein [Sporosalibacterium faouarense]|uniref:DUF2254 domain-containing protein n=1 Tax=Sporosalibacterium faouarense TaxID=516123 RepID=UPI00141C5581|nr:DUF2254 domain-containing protein [Sporosalibacterium faouarense]MTI46730.1 DUF2254 domain-containing protein [Bacillota bacterium]